MNRLNMNKTCFFLVPIFVFFTFFATAQTAKKTKPAKASSTKEGAVEEESFVPSLSETISDNHRLKSKIKRQLAREWSSDSSKGEGHLKKSPSSSAQTAHFGDFEIDISERKQEEELTHNKKKRR